MCEKGSDQLRAGKLGASRASDIRFALGTQTNLARDLGREVRISRARHQLESRTDLVVGKKVQEWRLSQGNTERSLQRVVENRVFGAVNKIGENNCVLVGQKLASMCTIVKPARYERGEETRLTCSRMRSKDLSWAERRVEENGRKRPNSLE
jgi:hypothetical protein